MSTRVSCSVFVVSTALAAVAQAGAGGAWQPLPTVAPAPADNPTTPAKVELGKMLYFDPRLSSTGTVSCFSCHNVMEGGDDHRPTSVGVHGQVGGRNAPSVWTAAFLSTQFWDGRAATLEDQAKGPPANPVEMGMPDLAAVTTRIAAIPGYRPYFEKAFGPGAAITMDNAARAIAAYERTLITPDSAYDRFARGDRKALSAQQVRGLETFAQLAILQEGVRVLRERARHQGQIVRGRLLEILEVDERSIPARAKALQGFIGGDPVDPGREA